MNSKYLKSICRAGRWARRAAIALFAPAALVASIHPAAAATWTVTSTADDGGSATLRYAVDNAAAGDTIVFDLPKPSTISIPTPSRPDHSGIAMYVRKDLTIRGPGAAALTVELGPNESDPSSPLYGYLFWMQDSATLTLSGLTLSTPQSGATPPENGVAFAVAPGTTLIATDLVVQHWWFAAEAAGNADFSRVAFADNCSFMSSGAVRVSDSAFRTVTVDPKILYCAGIVAAVDVSSGSFTAVNTTFSRLANPLLVESAATDITLVHSTFAGNNYGMLVQGAAGLNPTMPTVRLVNSLIANTGQPNCSTTGGGRIVSGGHNIDSDGSCQLAAGGDQSGTAAVHLDAKLDPAGAADNGGPTASVALLAGSPALDAVPAASCVDDKGGALQADQRGLHRPAGAACDVGAYELQSPSAPANLTATQGTQTGNVHLAWDGSGTATGYAVYAAGVALTPTPVPGTSFDVAVTDVAQVAYTVRAVNSAGSSADSAAATGYPNAAPTAASASLSATTLAASPPATPQVADPNQQAGETESFTFAILTQPAHGSAAVVSNALVWTPDATAIGGTETFTFRVTDRAGATFDGNATVTVSAPPPAPSGLTATQGTLTGVVRLTWTPLPAATGYNVYAADGTRLNATVLALPTFDLPVASVAPATYSVRALNAIGESPDSAPAPGYPNAAPISATAQLLATTRVAATPVAPQVEDPNAQAGEPESFAVAVLTQPLQGQASVLGNALTWTPAPDSTPGTQTFTFRVTDRGGASVTGTARVKVTAAPIVVAAVPTLHRASMLLLAFGFALLGWRVTRR